MQEKIIILDFGSQTTQLIGRRVRELNMYCEIVPTTSFHTMTRRLSELSCQEAHSLFMMKRLSRLI